jgi:hypothetical protein
MSFIVKLPDTYSCEAHDSAGDVLSLVTYQLWWDKLLNVQCPVRQRATQD